MALNREQKRLLKKQGEINEDGTQATRRARPATKTPVPKEQRTTARVFFKEVRSELRKVAWPTRPETLNYSGVVALTLAFVTGLIFVLDFIFGDIVLRIFGLK